jgi:hypothetical protein
MIGNPSRLVIRRRLARRTAAVLARFQQRSTSFVVDAMNGCSASTNGSSRSIATRRFERDPALNELITCVD